MIVWRLAFGVLLAWAVSYVAIILSNEEAAFSIDTGLADVAPTIASDVQTHQAIASLRQNIEQRIIFLISSQDEDQAYEAADELHTRLADLSALTLLPDNEQLIDDILQVLEPYRFNLLTQQQQKSLANSSQPELVNSAKRDVYSMASARLYPFVKDPFGLVSASLFEQLQRLQASVSNNGLTHVTVGASLAGDAMNMRQQAALSAELNQTISALGTQYEVTIDRSGVFFFASHAAQESKRDISFISTISSIGVIVLLLLVFRSVTALTLPVLSVLLGVGFAFLATHAVYGNVHVLTIVFGASLIGIVIDYSLHYFYHSASSSGTNSSANSVDEKKSLHNALLLSLCTSLIGYAALSFSGLDALKKVALFSCCGLVMAWLSVVCLGQLAMRRNVKAHSGLLNNSVSRIRNSLKRLPPSAIYSGLVLVVVGASAHWFINKPVSDDPRVFFNAPNALLESEQRVAAVANDYEPGRYVLLLGETIEQIQTRFEQMQRAIEQRTQLAPNSFSSVFNLVPSQQAQQQSYQSQAKLYDQQGALQALARELQMQDAAVEQIQQDYQQAFRRYLTPTDISAVLGKALPPMWFQSSDGYVGFVLIKKGVNADALRAALTGLDGVEYVNTLAKTRSALSQQRQSASALLLLAYVLVMGLLVTRFRQSSAALMVCVPLAASAMLVLLSLVFGYSLNLFHIMALFLVLGFGMDYTIFVRQMKAHQAQTLQAILLSAITSLLSFGLLSLSSIPVVASFGIALLIGNSFNLLGAFLYSRLIIKPA